MKKFQFKLKALLSYREHIEKMAKEEVAKVQVAINHCNQSILECENAHRISALEFENKMVEGISAEDHGTYSVYLEGLELKIASEEELLEKLKVIFIKKQEELTKKSVSKKVIEKLKDKKKAEYYDELDKQAVKDSDEMVLISRSFNEKSNES